MYDTDAFICTSHNVPMLVTQSGLQHVCPKLDCDQHVRAQGPRKEDGIVTKKENNDKQRLKDIEEAAARKKKEAASKPKEDAPPPAKKVKEDKPKKKEKDPNTLSVSDVAKEIGIEPKNARQKLRSAADMGPFGVARAPDGRWPTVERGSKLHKALVEFLTPEPPKEADDDDEEDDDEDADEDDE